MSDETPAHSRPAIRRPLRVLVAEDSSTVRALLVAILGSDPDLVVVGEARDGAEAVELARRLRPDVITMDVEMPVLDGLSATKEIMVQAPAPIVVVSASGSSGAVERAFHAVRAGAVMVLEKPTDPLAPGFDERRARFLAMVKAMAGVKVVRRWPAPERQRRPAAAATSPLRLAVIAASTGGPAALQRLLASLPREFPLPILVVQHIASGFVDGLASWLASGCDLRVVVARDAQRLEPRTVYLAPDDHHLGVTAAGTTSLVRGAPIAGHVPSADHLFTSAATAFGRAVVGIVLTGMGRDGVDGARLLSEHGGHVLAQDETSSVVYGMNRGVVEGGWAEDALPPDELGWRLAELVNGDGR